MKKWVFGAATSMLVTLAIPVVAYASSVGPVFFQGITTYLPTSYSEAVPSGATVHIYGVQTEDDGGGGADMVYDLGNGYTFNAIGEYRTSDWGHYWYNVPKQTLGLSIFNANYWYNDHSGYAMSGNLYVNY